MPNYPSSNYNTSINTNIDNIVEHKEVKYSTKQDGNPILTTNTETLNDLIDFSAGSAKSCMAEIEYYLTTIRNFHNDKEKSYFTKTKEPKLLKLINLAQNMLFEINRLRQEELVQENNTTTRLPNAVNVRYPSGVQNNPSVASNPDYNLPTNISNMTLWYNSQHLFQDVALTQPITADYQNILGAYDLSGNSNHGFQGAGMSAIQADYTNQLICVGAGSSGYLSMPPVQLNRRSHSMFFICETTTLLHSLSSPILSYQYLHAGLSTNATGFNFYLKDIPSGTIGVYDANTGGFKDSTKKPFSNFCLLGYTSDASGLKVWVNDSATSFTGLNTSTNFYLGNLFNVGISTVGYLPASGRYTDVMVWSRGLTDAEVTQLYNYAKNQGVQNASTFKGNLNIVADGDSITVGTATTLAQNWAQMAFDQFIFRNVAQPGQNIHNNILAHRPTYVDPLIDSTKTNTLFLFAGTNDLAGGANTGAAMYADTVSYGWGAHDAGWNKVAIMGMLPRTNVTESERQSARTLFLNDFSVKTSWPGVRLPGAGVTYADVYIDLGGDTQIGLVGQNTSVLYYSDGLHPAYPGHQIIATYARKGLQVLGLLS